MTASASLASRRRPAPTTPANGVIRAPMFLAGGVNTYRLGRSGWLWIALVGGLTLLPWLGSARVLTYHEVVFAEPAREMLATGSWIVPRIAGIPFTDKPPLTAWTIALSMALWQSEAEWVVRLPSVLAAIATAGLIGSLAALWFGRLTGLLSAFLHLTSFHVLMQGRLAEADSLLALTVTGTLYVFARHEIDCVAGRWTGRWVAPLFYTGVAASFMTKFLAGPALIVAAVGAFVVSQGSLRPLRFLVSPLGLMTGGLLTIPWCVAAYREFPAGFDHILLHNVGRFQGSMGLNEPAWAYLYLVPFMMVPWTPWVVAGIVQGVRGGAWFDRRWQWLGAWFVGGITLLTLMAYKSKHYTIPVLPPLAVFGAVGLQGMLAWRRSQSQLHSGLLATGVIVATAVGCWGIVQGAPRGVEVIVGLVATIGLGTLVILYWETQRRVSAQWVTGLTIVIGVGLGVQAGVMPAHDSYRAQTELAQRINARLGDERLILLGLPDNQITFYLQMPLERFDSSAWFHTQKRTWSTACILAPEYLAEGLATLGKVETLDRCATINRYLTERDRLTLVRWQPRD